MDWRETEALRTVRERMDERKHATMEQTLTLLTALLLGPLAALHAAESKPNIILILADDLGYGDLACYGHPKFKTPNIDRMAAEGAKLTHFNCPMAYCAPTRASLLTGRYPFRCGLTQNPAPDGGPDADGLHLPEGEVTLAQLLKQAGYATGMIGKWHLGHAKLEWLPTHRGFDEYFGIPYSNDMRPVQVLEGDRRAEYPVVQATLTQRYTARALDFIERNRARPFFLYLPHAMPHKPLAASEDFYRKSGAGLYGDAVAELDWSVGQVLAKLKARGLAENTFVVFTSDNGATFGGSTGGLRGMKGSSYEGGYRVPCLAWWPGKIPAGRLGAQPAVMMDLFATALKVAGVAPPVDRVIDGRDILPLFTSDAKSPHEVIFGQRAARLATVRDVRWKLHVLAPGIGLASSYKPGDHWTDPRAPDGVTILAPCEQATSSELPGLTTGDPPKPMQLFDLQADPGEQHDVAAQHPDVVARLNKAFDEMNQRPSPAGGEEAVIYQSTLGMAHEYHAQATAGALELAGDSTTKPAQAAALKIATRDATGWVASERFTLETNNESEFGTVFADVRFYVKASPDFRGQYEIRIFVPDAKAPEQSFSVPVRHFKAHGEDGTIVNGFQLTHKELCVINTINPALREWYKNGHRFEGCEVRMYLEKASGTLWLSDVVIRPARPVWSKESWEQFEQAAGEPIVLSQGNLCQPMYERYADHASPAVMDTVHKLLRVAGINAVSEWIGWGDDFGRRGFDDIHRLEACNAPAPGSGNADYGPSLDPLAAYIDNARYYGLQVGIMLQGTPDWTHPGRYNNRTPHSDFKDPLHNPGSASNGLSDPYPGPQTFKFESDQSVPNHGNHCQYPPDHWSDWEDLARVLVTRLKGRVLYYEIGNEIDCPDQACLVGGYIAALEYLRRFHNVAKGIDPKAAVVSPDASWNQMLPAMIANGLANDCDWYGFHSYNKNESYERIRRIVEAGGVRKHVMATEGPMLREAWIGKLRGQGLVGSPGTELEFAL